MKQIINAHTSSSWPGIEVDHPIPVELFIDDFRGYDANKKSFKILWIKEAEEISRFKTTAIQNHALFDAVITYDEDVMSMCRNSHFMEFGTAWVKDFDLSQPKLFQVSHLTGFKETTEGHRLRKKVHYKQDRIKIPRDFYISNLGGVENIFSNQILGDEKNDLFKSQFHICIENSRQKNYFTEKLIDCLVTKTVPIYYGCSNIGDFFDLRGIIIANDLNEVVTACNSLNQDSYLDRMEFVEKNFDLAQKYITIVDRLEQTINKILGK